MLCAHTANEPVQKSDTEAKRHTNTPGSLIDDKGQHSLILANGYGEFNRRRLDSCRYLSLTQADQKVI